MKINKKALLIAGLTCLLVIISVALIIGVGKLDNTPTEPSQPQGTVGTEEIVYTVEITNQGGLFLKDVGIFIYADSTLQDLVWFDRTDKDGKITFTALESDNYVAVLNEIPTGYAAESYYPLTGAQTKIVLGAATMGEEDELPTYKLGDMVMDFTFTGLDGVEHTLAELFEGKKAVVLNFWYLECQPCRAEFPFLQEAYAKHSDDVAVLGMNPINTDADAIAAFQKEMGITFPLVSCGSEWEQIMQLTAYPTTVVIDRFGNICLIHRGSIDKTAVFESMFTYFAADDYEQKLLGGIDELPMEEEEGSEENPEEVAGQTVFNVTVQPGKEHFLEVARVTGMYMSVTGDGDFYMLHDGKRYESKNGKIELVVTTGDNYTPSQFGFGHSGKEPLKLKVAFSFLKGTYGNPYDLEMGDFTAKVAAGNDQGVYYIYTAKEEGALQVQYLSGTKGVEYGLTLYNLTTGAYRTIAEDGDKDAEGIPTVAVKVNKGDQVQLIVAALPDKDFNYPGGTFNLRAKMADASEADKNVVPKMDYTVTVVDTDGNPVSGVTLTMTVEERATTFKTDGKGMVTVNLPVGKHKVTLTVPAGYTCSVTEYELTEEKPACTIKLVPQVVVKHDYTVIVLGQGGVPLANVTVIQGEMMTVTDAAGKAVFKDLVEFSYTVDIAKPDGYVVSTNGYTFPDGKWEMTVTLEKEILPGSAESPIAVKQYPFAIECIDPEQEIWYKLDNAGGMELTFFGGEGAYVVYNGKKYGPDFGGTVTVLLAKGDGQTIAFGNAGAESKKYNVSLQYPAGSKERPVVLSDLTRFNVALEAGDDDGLFYTWTAGENLEVTLKGNSGNATVTVGENTVTGPLKNGLRFEVTRGATVQIQITATKDSSGKYPAANIAVTGTQKTPNSAANPQVITNISKISLQLPADLARGYYYKWTAEAEGEVSFSITGCTPNTGADIVLTVGGKTVNAVNGKVSAKVEAGDEVLICVTAKPDASGAYPAVKVSFGGSFVLGNSATNPQVLSKIDSFTANLEAGDSDGYYYQWTAAETGTLSLTLANTADANVIISAGGKTVSLKDGMLDSNGKTAAIAEVVKGEKVQIQVIANPDVSGARPAVQVAVSGVLTLPNSAKNPIDISAYPFTAEDIPALKALYYRLANIDGMVLTIRSADAYIIYNGRTYSPVEGVVSVEISGNGQIVAVGNSAAEVKSFQVTTSYPLGAEQNPHPVSDLGQIAVTLAQGDEDGYHYVWTADKNYVVSFAQTSITEGVSGNIHVSVNGDELEAKLADGLCFEANKGEEVRIHVTVDEVAGTKPAAQIGLAGALADGNSILNPEVIADISAFTAKIRTKDNDGRYFSWTAAEKGTLILTFAPGVTRAAANTAANVLVTVNDAEQAVGMTDGIVSVPLNKDDQVLIQVLAPADAEGNSQAAVLTVNGQWEKMPNCAENPDILTEIAQIAATLEAGDADGWFYVWNVPTNGTATFQISQITESVTGDVILTVGEEVYTLSQDGTAEGLAVVLTGGTQVQLQIAAQPDAAGNYPAAQITVAGHLEQDPNGPENPDWIESIGQSVNVTLAAGDSDGHYYAWKAVANGTVTFSVTGTRGVSGSIVLTAGDHSVTGNNGTASVDVKKDQTVLIQVTAAEDAAELALNGSFVYELGSAQNPKLTDTVTSLRESLAEGDDDGCYYSWTATENGILHFAVSGGKVNVRVNGLSVADIANVTVEKGDALSIQLIAEANEGVYPAAQVVTTTTFTYALGSVQNPEVITDLNGRTVALTQGDEDGYFYKWTSAEDGTVTLKVDSTTNNAAGEIIATFGEVTDSLLEDGKIELEVTKNGVVSIQVIAAKEQGVYPKTDITFSGSFTLANSATNPIDVRSNNFVTPAIKAGKTMYFRLYGANGMVLNLTTGSLGAIIYNGAEAYGDVMITGDAQIVALRNEGEEACAYTLSWNYPLGTAQNPEIITDVTQIDIIKTLTKGVLEEYCYRLTVPGKGDLKLTRNADNKFTYNFKVNGVSKTVNESSKAKTLAVNAGDVVDITLKLMSSYSTVDVNLMGGVVYTSGSILNPKALRIGTISCSGNAVDSNGIYTIWTATGEGEFKLRRISGTSVMVIMVNGVEQARVSSTAYVPVYVDEGDVVLLQALPTTSGGVSVNFRGQSTFTAAEGSRTNPKALESKSTINVTTDLKAGDDNGYYYSFTCPSDIEAGTLFLNAEKRDKTLIKLTLGDTVATSSNGHVYMKIKAGDVVTIQVMAIADSNGYPALTTAISGGIKEPPGAVGSGKIRYTVSVTETNNVSVTGLKVNFKAENGAVTVVDVVNGEAIADLAPGTYTVTPIDPNGAYFLNTKTAMVTVDVKNAELRVTKIAHVDEGSTLKDAWYMQDENGVSQWYAYEVKIGVTEVMVNTTQPNYSADNEGNCFFVFMPTSTGTYEFTAENKDARISVWSASASGFFNITPEDYNAATNTFAIEVMQTQFDNGNKPMYVIGLKCAPTVSKTRLIITDLNKVPQDITLMEADMSWYSGYVPTAFNLKLTGGQSIVPVSETATYKVVYNESDGYYHFNTANGPIVYVNLDFSNLSFKKMINPGGNTGTAFRKYWYADGLCTKKEEYTDVMTQYILNACEITQGETTYLLYPMTKDLQYMMEVGGQRWWDISYNDGAEFIYKDDEGNNRTDVTLNPGWLFACCQVSN